MKDLAQLCGVSLGTVDRAMNNKPGISQTTKDKILRIAKEHDYKPDRIAQSLQSGKTYEIGLIVHDLNNRFFSQLVDAVQQTAWEHDYYIQLAVSLRDKNRELDIIEHMLQRNVDGILLFATNTGNDFYNHLRSLGKPIVLLSNKVEGPEQEVPLPFVGLNNKEITTMALEGIIQRGYKNIHFVAPYYDVSYKHNYYEIEQRYRTFERIVSDHNIKHHAFLNKSYLEEIKHYPIEEKSAFFCVSDIFALELISLFTEMGKSIPQHVGVMGFDNIDVLKYVRPQLSTIDYPVKSLGTTAFLLLEELMQERKTEEKVILKGELIWRDSI